MPDIWMDVDTALAEVPVNLFPLIDDTDFKSIEAAIAYNAAGMALYWHFVTPAGAYTVTAVTPTTGGNYDWTDQGDAGIYTIEIPASGGASINNDTEGVGWFTGKVTGVLAWRGPTIGFRRAALNDLMIEGSTASTNLEDFFDGTGYAGGTIKLTVDLAKILGTALTETSAGYLAAGFKKLHDVATPLLAIDAAGLDVLVDRILTRAFGSVTYTGTTRCILTALQAIRNKFQAATGAAGYKVMKEDDSTPSWTGVVTVEDGVITAMDPDS